MKKLLLLSFLSWCFISNSIAQQYFPKGAKWYYNLPDFSSPSFEYTTIESMGDSIFNNDTLTFLKGGVNCSAGSNVLIKQSGKKIYRLNSCDSTYSLLYDFGANAGDTLTIFPDICYISDSVVIKIDSISTININGNNLNYFHVSQLNNTMPWWFSQNIIEGIGNIHSFYPLLGFCDPNGGPLRCYEDSVIGYYNTGLYYSCDTSYTVGIDENITDYQLKISPNPTSSQLQVSASKKIQQIELLDIKGSSLLKTNEHTLSLDHYSKGIYLLKVYFNDKVFTQKILKE